MKIKKVMGMSMALATLISSTVSTVSPAWAGSASGNASGNAAKDDIVNGKELSQLTAQEKREILLKVGFVDETINVLLDEEIDYYCEKYLDGLDVVVETTCKLLNEEEVMKESFEATKEDYLAKVDYSASEEEIAEQIAVAEQIYTNTQEKLNDLTTLSDEEISEKYGYDIEHSKIAKSIAEDVTEEKAQSTIEVSKESIDNTDDNNKSEESISSEDAVNDKVVDTKSKGKKVRSCSSGAHVTTSISVTPDDRYTYDGRKLDLTYKIKSNYDHDWKYMDIMAIGWDGKLEIDAIKYRTAYDLYSTFGLTYDEMEYCNNKYICTSNYSTKTQPVAIVEPKETTFSSKSSTKMIDDMETAKMVCWTSEQVYDRQYKNYLNASMTYHISDGMNTVYVHPNKEANERSCTIYGEYIHKTNFLQSHSGGLIDLEDYTDDYFPKKSKSKLASGIIIGIETVVGIVKTPAGVALTAADFLITNYCSLDNIDGPVCAKSITMKYK